MDNQSRMRRILWSTFSARFDRDKSLALLLRWEAAYMGGALRTPTTTSIEFVRKEIGSSLSESARKTLIQEIFSLLTVDETCLGQDPIIHLQSLREAHASQEAAAFISQQAVVPPPSPPSPPAPPAPPAPALAPAPTAKRGHYGLDEDTFSQIFLDHD
ncbi:hypothetical protein BBC27_14045 [Acidithiobacillus ferrivorans]|uniref:Uncharacterized protein n=1 Tax=Acidithiobacillus ferrivorans TaxID=160808 RepID=A0A1B9BX74_9PROT|nr:hypothetical protein [Acidithiobacillus ferrivorans]OCB02317.1 hypothetical protein BBC27_14045 [Acidithiobacillus ferrivorans]